MRRTWLHLGLAACAVAALDAGALAQPTALPIAQGVWVEASQACAAATYVRIYDGRRFGDIYFYGPNQSMGPANETAPVTQVGPGQDGFTIVNDGPIEVKPLPNGQAIIRAFSPAQGEVWTENVRLCPLNDLPARVRAAVSR